MIKLKNVLNEVSGTLERMLPNGKWKYVVKWNGSQPLRVHDMINKLEDQGISWRIVDAYGYVGHHSKDLN